MRIRRCPSMENNGDSEKDYSRYSLSCCSSSREEGFHFPGTDQQHYYSGVFFDLDSSDSDDADESFIEISLESHQPPPPPPPSGHQQTAVAATAVDQEEKEVATHEEDDDDDDHLEFRISFSSPTAAACVFSPPQQQHVDDVKPHQPPQPQCLLPSTSSASLTTTIDPTSVSSSSSSSLSSSMEVNEPDLPKIIDSNNSESTSSRMVCRVRFPEEHDDDNVMMGHTPTLSFSCLRAFSAVNRRDEDENLHDEEAIIIEDCNAGHRRHHGTAARVHTWKLLRSRKVTKVKTAINGGIMKLFIKFRSIKIRSVLSSYMNTREEDVSDSQHHSFSLTGCSNTIFEEEDDDGGGGGDMANMRPVKRWMPSSSQLRDHMSKNMNDSNDDSSSDIGGYGSFSSFSNIKRTTGSKVGTRKGGNISKVVTRSCPSSVKCSPIHKSSNYNKEVVVMRNSKIYTIQENSVEAAIAYCKGSIV